MIENIGLDRVGDDVAGKGAVNSNSAGTGNTDVDGQDISAEIKEGNRSESY